MSATRSNTNGHGLDGWAAWWRSTQFDGGADGSFAPLDVRLRQRYCDERLSIRTAALDERRVDVTVADTGTGLTPELIDRIFNPFFSTKPLGLGLGLSISRSIIEAHGGRLWVEPNPTGGSQFHFSLAAR